MSRKAKVIILSLIIVLLGFLRDYLFMNTNDAFRVVQNGRDLQSFHGRDEFEFMLNWSTNTFLIAKWIATFIFFGLFFFLSWIIVKMGFQNPTYTKITALSYVIIIGVTCLLYAYGTIFSWSFGLYDIVHTIMMFGQSFMPLLILVLLFKYFPKSSEQQS